MNTMDIVVYREVTLPKIPYKYKILRLIKVNDYLSMET